MSNIDVLRRALQRWRPGSLITVDVVRPELESGQVPPSAYGRLFGEACAKGLLWATGSTWPSRWRPAKGRRVLVYMVRDQNRPGAAA